MVDDEKLRRLERAAAGWLASQPGLDGLDVALEVVAVRAGRLEHVDVAL